MWCHGYLLSLSKSIHLIYDLHISKTNHHLVTHLRTSSLLDNKLTSLIWPLQVFFIYFILEDGVIHHSSWTAVKKNKKKPKKKQRVTVSQNHNKLLLRQSLTGSPSGSCAASWDNDTVASRQTTCFLSFTWFITPFLQYWSLTRTGQRYL